MIGLSDHIYMNHAFISYRSYDLEAAGAITSGLQEFGLRPWWDRDAGELDRAPREASDTRGQPIPGGNEAVEAILAEANWREKEATRSTVEIAILDYLWAEDTGLPVNSYTEQEVRDRSMRVYQHFYVQQAPYSRAVYV